MMAHFSIVLSHLAGNDFDLLFLVPVLHPSQLIWKQPSEPTMYVPNTFDCTFTVLQAPFVNPSLDFDMSLGFKLKIAFLWIVLRKIVIECTLNVYRMRIVALDEIAVVAVHRSDEVSERLCQPLW